MLEYLFAGFAVFWAGIFVFFWFGMDVIQFADFLSSKAKERPTMTSSQLRKPVETVPERKTTLPADVHPESRSRLPLVKRENLDEAGRKAYDAVTDPNSRLKAQLVGPAGIWLNVPELSPHIREINWFLRNRFPLDDKLTELIILVTARASDAQIEWSAHEPAALKAGLAQHIVDIVKYRRDITGADAKEAAVIRLGRELLEDILAARAGGPTPVAAASSGVSFSPRGASFSNSRHKARAQPGWRLRDTVPLHEEHRGESRVRPESAAPRIAQLAADSRTTDSARNAASRTRRAIVVAARRQSGAR